MDRREALKRLALLTGGALSFSTVAGFMGGCKARTNTDYSPQTLSPVQDKLVAELSEQIIPATDTPGAKAAKVNQYIDHMLTNWNTEEEKEYFLERLGYVDEISNNRYDQDFLDLDEEEKIAVMENLEQEALENPNPEPNSDLKPFFSMMKEYTVVGYYTSEIGATQELNYTPVPGRYNGCMAYDEAGRAWA